MRELPQGTVTFLFTDVEESTVLTRHLGERYGSVLADSRRLLREALAEHGGVEVDTQGDGLFAAFDSARDGVLAAAAAQRSHAAHEWADRADVRVRMALHTAEPGVWEEGYVGMGLTRAARICAVGHGGQVLLSRATAGIVADDPFDGINMRHLGAHRLKGLVWPEEIFELVIEGLPTEFPPLNTPEGAGPTTETATVLVTDVVGLTAMARTLDPEVFRAMISQYHERAQAVWRAFDGLGIQAVGDSSIAVFRSARNAVRSAVRVQQTMLGEEWPGGVALQIKVGLDSGEVLATAYGYFGHAVNRSFAVCSTAHGGQTLVTEATRGLLHDRELGGLRLVDLGEREFGEGSIRVYEIVEGAP